MKVSIKKREENCSPTSGRDRILSIDQAARVSGWSFWVDGKLTDCGVIEPIPKSIKGGDRLHSLRQQFASLIDKCQPTHVLIEDPVGGEDAAARTYTGSGAYTSAYTGAENNWKTMQTLCQVQGVLLELLTEKEISHEIVSPSSWQYSIGIHRRDRDGRKAGARKYVEETYGLKDISQDIVDSVCIYSHYAFNNQRSAF